MRLAKVAIAAVLSLGLSSCGAGDGGGEIGSSAATTTITSPTTTTEPPATSSPTTTASTVRRSTASTAAVTTTRRPATTTPAPTTTAGGRVGCTGAQLVVEVSTDRATYRPGERVQATATLRNRSSAPCFYASYSVTHRIEDSSGQLMVPIPILVADNFTDTALVAGATMTQGPSWDQRACPDGASCVQAPPGTYTVKVSWGFLGAPVEGSSTFRLVAA
ncbi:MAG: hypothetical protein ACR2KK_14610 [Acidimicrobiales bacterium]